MIHKLTTLDDVKLYFQENNISIIAPLSMTRTNHNYYFGAVLIDAMNKGVVAIMEPKKYVTQSTKKVVFNTKRKFILESAMKKIDQTYKIELLIKKTDAKFRNLDEIQAGILEILFRKNNYIYLRELLGDFKMCCDIVSVINKGYYNINKRSNGIYLFAPIKRVKWLKICRQNGKSLKKSLSIINSELKKLKNNFDAIDQFLAPFAVASQQILNYSGFSLGSFEIDCYNLRGGFWSFPFKFLHSRTLTTDQYDDIFNNMSWGRDRGLTMDDVATITLNPQNSYSGIRSI